MQLVNTHVPHITKQHKYVLGHRTELHADRVACYSMLSHVEYALRALLRLEKIRDRQTDDRPKHYAFRPA